LKDKLRPFQKSGILWLEKVNGIGLLADEMGLGKSAQAIIYLYLNPELRPALIICPASIKINWTREIEKWSGEESMILYGKKATHINKSPWYIINYDVLAEEIKIDKKKVLKDTSWIFKLASMGIKAIIIDECQAIVNSSAIRSKAVTTLKKILPNVKFIALSGTPIKNRPREFFTILNLLSYKVFPNRWKYLFKFCNPKHNGFGWTFDGATNIDKLQELIKPLMLRRTKDEVLKDLPPKQRIIIPLETDKVALKNYEDATEQFKIWAKDHIDKGLELQINIDRLKQLAYLAKRNSCVKWLEEYPENKLVVATYHKNTLEDLYTHFKKISVFIDGSITGEKRQLAIDTFQKDKKIKFIFIQILCAPGLTLTAANATCTVEFSWSPSDHFQLEDRVHRLTQEADSVFAYYLIAPKTIEEDIISMIDTKQVVLGKLLDNKENDKIFNQNNIVENILKKMNNDIYNIDRRNKMDVSKNINIIYIKYPGRDWENDKIFENGNYECNCVNCNRPFIEHKRRIICFECDYKAK
jgi:SWI/SNF-related matrix-associated actin-dependent regulator 1 of chromatin subfamily A